MENVIHFIPYTVNWKLGTGTPCLSDMKGPAFFYQAEWRFLNPLQTHTYSDIRDGFLYNWNAQSLSNHLEVQFFPKFDNFIEGEMMSGCELSFFLNGL